MARRTKEITIAAEGRDKGTKFLITEMPAEQAEWWFDRLSMMLLRAGTDIPPNIFQHGALGFAVIGIGALVAGIGKSPPAEVKPLLDEMWACVAYLPPVGNAVPITARELVDGQIEEVATRLMLREEVLSLHLGFSLRARLSHYRDLLVAAASSSPTTSTSPGDAQPSPAGDSPA